MSGSQAVALVCPYDLNVPGGVQGQVVMMALELARRGRRVLVASPGGRPTELEGARVEHLAAGQTRTVAANGSAAPVSFDLLAAHKVAGMLRSSDVGVIHLHEPLTPVVGWPALLVKRHGLVGTFHRSGVDRTYRLAGAGLGWLARRLDVAVAVAPAAAETAHEVIGLSPEVLFNGIDLDAYAAAVPWPTSGPTCLFLGRDEARKGRDVLLAASQLLEAGTTLWVCGEPPAGWREPRRSRVEFLGVISEEEKRQRLRGSDVLVAPALGGESFGMVLLEGLAAGASVVASDIDGYRQALGGAGILVEPGDPAALAAGITSALSFPRSDAPAPRANEFSIRSLVDRYEELYVEASDRARRRK